MEYLYEKILTMNWAEVKGDRQNISFVIINNSQECWSHQTSEVILFYIACTRAQTQLKAIKSKYLMPNKESIDSFDSLFIIQYIKAILSNFRY